MFFSFGNYFISDSFAIDFTDSTGYSASWAKNYGYQTVLLKCDEFSGDSRDGKWCMEWIANVLDQGFENFPQSTSESNKNIPQNKPMYLMINSSNCVHSLQVLMIQKSSFNLKTLLMEFQALLKHSCLEHTRMVK